MFCTQCGNENEQSAKFCTSCGAPLEELPVEGEDAAQPIAAVEAEETTVDQSTIAMEAVVVPIAQETAAMDAVAATDPQATIAMDSVPTAPAATTTATTTATTAATTAATTTAALPITSVMEPLQPAAPKHYNAAATAEAQQQQQQQASGQKPKNKRGILIALIVILVIAALAAAGIFFFTNKQAQERESLLQELASKTYPVSITIEAQGYYPQTSSPIPLKIEGTTYSGENVEQKLLIRQGDQDTIELMRGTYAVTVPVSPVTQEGGIFQTGQAMASFEVTDPEVEQFLASSEESKPDAEQIKALLDVAAEPVVVTKLVLTPLSPLSVTDELIARTYEGLIEYGLPQSEAAQFQNAMVEGHQRAVKEQKAERAADRDVFRAQLEAFQSTENGIMDWMHKPNDPGFPGLVGMDEQMAKLRPLTRQFVDELYAYVLDILPESERGALQTSQQEWDSAATKAAEDYYAPFKKQGATAGQSLTYVKMYVDANLSRAGELINMID